MTSKPGCVRSTDQRSSEEPKASRPREWRSPKGLSTCTGFQRSETNPHQHTSTTTAHGRVVLTQCSKLKARISLASRGIKNTDTCIKMCIYGYKIEGGKSVLSVGLAIAIKVFRPDSGGVQGVVIITTYPSPRRLIDMGTWSR